MQLADIGVLVAILSAMIGFFWSLFKLLKKIIEFIDSVNSVVTHVNEIDNVSEVIHKDFDKRLDLHDQHLVKHDEEIKTLFNRTGDKK